MTSLMDGWVRKRKDTQVPDFGLWAGGNGFHIPRDTQKTTLGEDDVFGFVYVEWGHFLSLDDRKWLTVGAWSLESNH